MADAVWECTACTYAQSAHNVKCEICDTPQPKEAGAPSYQSGSDGGSEGKGSGGSGGSGGFLMLQLAAMDDTVCGFSVAQHVNRFCSRRPRALCSATSAWSTS